MLGCDSKIKSSVCLFVSLSPAGSIIRCMRRLEEVLRQMCSAAKAIGNTELENKFAEGKKHQSNQNINHSTGSSFAMVKASHVNISIILYSWILGML